MTFTAAETTTHYVPQDLPSHIQHYINGEFVDSVGGETFDVLDPVSKPDYATAAAGQKADIDLAVAAARDAFTNGPWPRMQPRERARVLHRIADAVEAQDARLAELETFDTGLPITQAKGQALRAAENFRFFADLIVAQFDDAMKVPGAPDQLRQPQADRRRRPHHAVEHPVHARVVEARPRPGHRQHRGAQARRVHPALGVAVGRRSSRRPACPTACSTSSTASARKPATRWSSTRTCR